MNTQRDPVHHAQLHQSLQKQPRQSFLESEGFVDADSIVREDMLSK